MRSMQNPRSVLLSRELWLSRPWLTNHRSSIRRTQINPPHSHRLFTRRLRSSSTHLNHQYPQTTQEQIPSIQKHGILTPSGRKPPVTLYIYKYSVKKKYYLSSFKFKSVSCKWFKRPWTYIIYEIFFITANTGSYLGFFKKRSSC
jgi:hypothetical protein